MLFTKQNAILDSMVWEVLPSFHEVEDLIMIYNDYMMTSENLMFPLNPNGSESMVKQKSGRYDIASFQRISISEEQ